MTGLLCILVVYDNDLNITKFVKEILYIYYYLFYRSLDPRTSIFIKNVSMHGIFP